jgi:hypothetical protein
MINATVMVGSYKVVVERSSGGVACCLCSGEDQAMEDGRWNAGMLES